MNRTQLIERLMATFLDELQEHVTTLDDGLLALERDPNHPERTERIKALFRAAHSLKGAARSVDAAPIEGACHRLEEILGGVRDGTIPLSSALFQELFAMVDGIAAAGKALRATREGPAPPPSASLPSSASERERDPTPHDGGGSVRVPASKLDTLLDRGGELMVARRRIEAHVADAAQLHASIARSRRDHRRLVRLFDVEGAKAEDPSKAAAAPTPARPARRAASLFAQVGERLRDLERDAERLAAALAADASHLRLAAVPLEEEIHRVRMLPFGDGCHGLFRSARDLAKAAGKDVELVLAGARIELDRAILDSLKDPLLHLVRNAIDHGIETAAERARRGKPQRARVTVGAELRGGSVEVTVADDGAGIDLAAVREQARRRGMPEPEDDRELARLVFLPGLSTSSTVTQLSGRGIGLDVVKSRLESLHGNVEVRSERGKGTTFTLTVPLTLTMVRALLVRAHDQAFAFVAASVETVLRMAPADLRSVEGRVVLLADEAPMPVVALGDALGLPTLASPPLPAGARLSLVVLRAGDHRAAFLVDELVTEQDVIVKGLGARLRHLRHVSGATTLADGKVALILRSAELVRSARVEAPRRPLVSSAASAAAPRKRVLVVDDSVTTRALQKGVLENEGYDVIAAPDGAEAWRILESGSVDLVVSDVEMPRMDGFALTEAIRASARLRELPVVLVTALESERDRARGIEVGADAYLPKSSFDPRQLLETIKQLL